MNWGSCVTLSIDNWASFGPWYKLYASSEYIAYDLSYRPLNFPNSPKVSSYSMIECVSSILPISQQVRLYYYWVQNFIEKKKWLERKKWWKNPNKTNNLLHAKTEKFTASTPTTTKITIATIKNNKDIHKT